MDAIERYFEEISRLTRLALESQKPAVEQTARAFVEATRNKKRIFAFGASHAGLVTLELFYRTGGLVTINPIRAPGMMLDMTPITSTSKLERLDGYGKLILDGEKTEAGDVLLVHSVSGRNAVAIDMAIAAKEKGMKVIVLTNMNTSGQVTSRHKTGKKLYELADILIDNCGCKGDSSLTIDGVMEKTAPTSTVMGAMLLNAAVARAVELLAAEGIDPPVFMSANLDGGDEHNRRVLDEYHNQITYM